MKYGKVRSMSADAKDNNCETVRETICREWKNKDKDFCLCVGSGVTRKFVGTWSELLNQLLCTRMVNRWLEPNYKLDVELVSEHGNNRNLDGMKDIVQNMDRFSFFDGEGTLEQGDYLLSDDREQNVFHSEEERQAWQEKYFSRQVSLVLEKKIRDFCTSPLKGMEDSCKDKACRDTCLIYKTGRAENVAEVFLNLKKANENVPFSNRQERQDVFSECRLYHELSTLMAVAELCLSGAVRFIINYNFDTVIEQILADDRVLGLYGRTPDRKLHIHIWTYGSDKRSLISFSGTTSDTKQADGYAATKVSELYQIHYHIGEEWIFQTQKTDEDVVHFFHVHGVCGEPDGWMHAGNGANMIRPLVFSEHSYTEYQKAGFNWSNRTLSNLMSNFSILTVGFSGVDANFRTIARAMKNSDFPRILLGDDGSADSRRQDSDSGKSGGLDHPRIILLRAKQEHVWKFKKTVEDSAVVAAAGGQVVSPELQGDQIKVFSNIYERMVENYYRHYFDITVFWEEDFDCIAGFLMERTDSFSMKKT